jgi:tetratricopeptide (TPR) repeat protein
MNQLPKVLLPLAVAATLATSVYSCVREDAPSVPSGQAAALRECGSALDRLSYALERLRVRLDAAVTDQAALRATVADLDRRWSHESDTAAAAAVDAGPAAVESASPPGPAGSKADGPVPPTPEALAEFRELLGRVLGRGRDREATAEEKERFWEMARNSPHLRELMRRLESEVAANGRDPAARMALADAYVAKLLSVPAGPLRGIWGMKAEAQWRKVLEQDPNHWEAQFNLAYGQACCPDFMNLTGSAIEGLERARTIQERIAPEPRFAITYLELSRLYLKQGDKAKARAVLRAGLDLHPHHHELLEAWGKLE